MISKIVNDLQAALAGVKDGSTVLLGGFGGAGQAHELLDALIEQGATDLTIVSNNAGSGTTGIAALLAAGKVRKIICSFPRQADSHVFDGLYRSGKVELELVPQGTLAERIRAGGAGIGGFFTPTGYGTELGEGKEVKLIDGVHQVFEKAIKADVALIKAQSADRYGNLIYHGTARNYGPVMATAAACTVVQVSRIVPLGSLNPEHVVTPGVYVQRVVCVQPQGAL